MQASSQLATELYAEIAQHLSSEDLLALAATCHKLNDVANRLLYARIELDGKATTRGTVMSLLSALQHKRLARLALHLELHWLAPPEARDDASHPAELIAVVLPKLTNLTFLSISPSLEMNVWVFDAITLPSLLQFHSYGPGGISSDFVERHPRLTHLSLCQPHLGDFRLKKEMEHLVFLRLSCMGILEQFLSRQTRPTLKRIGFGRLEPEQYLSTLVSKVASHRWPVPHVDMFGRISFLLAVSGAGPAAHQVTSVGLAACDFLYEPASVVLFIALQNVHQLFPAVETLAIHCSNSSHKHSAMAPLPLEDFIHIMRQVEGLQHVCVSEYLGSRVISVERDGQRHSECVPTGQRDSDYQLIPWPEC